MDLKTLKKTPAWDWPEGTATMLRGILSDDHAEESERLLAAQMAGDFTVMNDELANALLAILRRGDEAEELRCTAAISLGPALEHADTMGFEDPDDDLLSEEALRDVQRSLRKLFRDAGVSQDVRRRILEASVRATEEWHKEAVRAAYYSDSEAWRLTALFCMRFTQGFDEQILEALKSDARDIHYEAVCAAGNWGVEGAWSHVAALVTTDYADKGLLLAAIDAAANIRPREAPEILADLTDSDDEDIVEGTFEALAMAERSSEWEDHNE